MGSFRRSRVLFPDLIRSCPDGNAWLFGMIMWETPHRCHQVCPTCSLHRAARQLNIDQSLFFPDNHIALVFSSTVRSRFPSNSCKTPSDK